MGSSWTHRHGSYRAGIQAKAKQVRLRVLRMSDAASAFAFVGRIGKKVARIPPSMSVPPCRFDYNVKRDMKRALTCLESACVRKCFTCHGPKAASVIVVATLNRRICTKEYQ
jgi:hypothetical protein